MVLRQAIDWHTADTARCRGLDPCKSNCHNYGTGGDVIWDPLGQLPSFLGTTGYGEQRRHGHS